MQHLAILETLPLKNVMMVYLCIVRFVYLATTVDSCAYVLAEQQPKIYHVQTNQQDGIVFFLGYSILHIINWLNDDRRIRSSKNYVDSNGLPLIGVLILLMVSVRRMLINSDNH